MYKFLTDLDNKTLKKKGGNIKLERTEEHEACFKFLKEICTNTQVLTFADYSKPFKVHTHASEIGLGTIPYQDQDDGTIHVIAYTSCSLSKSEKKYHSSKLEFLALKLAITEQFRKYLYWGTFEVHSDNNPLTYILTMAKLGTTGQRWIAALANDNFQIIYRSGKQNIDADAQSRIPWKTEQGHCNFRKGSLWSEVIYP